jgi:hypothetical protein
MACHSGPLFCHRGEEHEGSRDDSFCKNGYFFREFSRPFSYVRRLPPEDSVVKVRTIRFVGLPFIFAGRGSRRGDVVLAMTNDKVQMPNKIQNPNVKRVTYVWFAVGFWEASPPGLDSSGQHTSSKQRLA